MAPATLFDPSIDIPDLSGKIILVTGGNSGLGLESVRQIAKHKPAKIYLAARSEAKANAAIADIHRESPSAPVVYLQLDLASLASVKSAAQTFSQAESRLDLLIANGGIMMARDGLTQDGYEVHFGTNHMGHALLTQLLMPMLRKTASITKNVRVVFVASAAEGWAPAQPYAWELLRTDYTSVNDRTRYGISKLANVHYASALAQHYPDLIVASIDPGVVKTNLTQTKVDKSNAVVGTVLKTIFRVVGSPVEKGALNQLWASFATNVKSGAYYLPIGVVAKGSKNATDTRLRDKLWTWTESELRSYTG